MAGSSRTKDALWIVALVASAALGWTAAMLVEAGAPIADEEDAYVRFSNALENPDSLERTEILLDLTKKLTPEVLPGAIRAYAKDVRPLADSDIRFLMTYWIKQDPREVMRETRRWDNDRAQRLAASEAVFEIARTEGYDAAYAFWQDDLQKHERDGALVALVWSYMDGDIDDLAGFITSFSDHHQRDIVGHVAMERMIDLYGPEAVQRWTEGLPPGVGNSSDIKRVALRTGLRAHLDNGHREAFEAWLQKHAHEPWTKGAWRLMGIHMAKKQPIEAIEWARALPEDGGNYDRQTVTQEIIRIWASRDPEAAVAWILNQEPHPDLDRGTGRLAVHYAVRNRTLSIELMRRIVSPTTFKNTRRTVSRSWARFPEPVREEALAEVKAIAQARLARTRAAESEGAEDDAEGEGAALDPPRDEVADDEASADAARRTLEAAAAEIDRKR